MQKKKKRKKKEEEHIQQSRQTPWAMISFSASTSIRHSGSFTLGNSNSQSAFLHFIFSLCSYFRNSLTAHFFFSPPSSPTVSKPAKDFTPPIFRALLKPNKDKQLLKQNDKLNVRLTSHEISRLAKLAAVRFREESGRNSRRARCSGWKPKR